MSDEYCSYPVGDCVISQSQEYQDKKYKKIMHGIFQDFFRDASITFKGRVDEGNISLKELNDFIEKWVAKHLG